MDAEPDDMNRPQLQFSHHSKWTEFATQTHSWDLQLGKYCSSTPCRTNRDHSGKRKYWFVGLPLFL